MKFRAKLLLVFAVALIASTATASVALSNGTMHFNASHAPTVFTGTQTAPHTFKTAAGELSCANSAFEGTQGNVVATTLTATATFTNCVFFGFANSHVKMNGCDLELTTPTTRIAADHYTLAPPHVRCDSGKAIEFTPTDPFFGLSVCTLSVPAQTPTSGGITAINQGSGTTRDFELTSYVKGIHYTVAGGGGLCGSTGVTHSDGEYVGTGTVRGYDDNNSNVDNSHTGVHEPLEVTGS